MYRFLAMLLNCRDANAVAAAVLADLPPGKALEEEIEADLGTGASKVWKEVKLLLQPQGKCENKEHAGKVDGEEELVCEEADCLQSCKMSQTRQIYLCKNIGMLG